MKSEINNGLSTTAPAAGSAAPAPVAVTPDDPTRTREPTRDRDANSAAETPASTQPRNPARYQILGEHGRGGLGRVSRAHDLELGRDVAIKELISRSDISEIRFLREALITARLEHPAIVPVHEAGRWPDGTPFYAMKLVAGRPLAKLIAERRTVDERIGLLHHVIAVADAIAYAHGRSIIHRDLKPANIIVGDFGETVVIDWGLAKDLTASDDPAAFGAPSRASRDRGLTSVGAVLGTPAYMAPEQQRGEPVDQRVDVFAIGAMLWELCTLERLAPGDTGQRDRILRRAGIDPDLAAIIHKAIDLDPDRRYPNAGALAADLKAFKAGARIAARRYSLLAMFGHWTRRHRALALTASIAIVVATMGAALYVHDIARERDRVAAANAALTLEHAELLLHSDPTAAFATLATYRGGDDARQHRLVAEARGLGIATATLALHSDTIWFALGGDAGEIVTLGEDGRIQLTRGTSSTTITGDVSTTVVSDYAAPTRLLAYATAPAGVAVLPMATKTPQRIAAIRVRGLRFSPSGSRLAALDVGGELVVWAVTASGAELVHREPVPGAIRLRFATESRIIVQDAAGLRAISLDPADPVAAAAPHAKISAFDADGEGVAVGTTAGDLELRMPDLGIAGTRSLCHKPVTSVQFVPHGHQIAFACQDGYSGLLDYDRALASPNVTVTFPTQGLTIVTVDGGGRYVTALDQTHTAYIHDLGTRLTQRYAGSPGRPTYIAPPTPEFAHVLIGDANGTVRVWGPPTTAARVVLQGPAPVFGIAFAPDGSAMITSGVERIARYVDPRTGSTVELRGHTGGVRGARISPDGTSALTYSYDGTVRVWRTSDFTTIREFREHGSPVEDAEYIDGGRHIASVGDDGRLLVWAPDGSGMSVRFQQRVPLARLQVLSHNGHIVVRDTAGSVSDVAPDGTVRQVRSASGDAVTMMRAAPDGSLLAIGTGNGHVAVHATVDWHVVTTLDASGGIRQIAFDPLGRDLLVASEAGHAQFGHVQLVPLGTQRYHRWHDVTAAVRNAAYAPDGETLGFVCDDGSAWLYSFRDDTWAYANDHYTDTLTAMFSPDGRRFASSDRQGVLVIRDVASSFLVNPSQHVSEEL